MAILHLGSAVRLSVASVASIWLLLSTATAGQQSPDPFDAISNDRPEDLAAYLDAGGDPNASDSGKPLLIRAVQANRKFAYLLLEHNANANVQEKEFTPLFFAVQERDTELVNALIAHGARLNPINEEFAPPLWAAMDDGDIELAKLLMSRGAIMPKGYESLLYAVRSTSVELTRLAIEANAPNAARFNIQPNRIPPQDMTEELQKAPLIVQANMDVLQLLLDNGFDTNVDGGVALATAAVAGDIERVELLLAHGANPNFGRPINGGTDIPIIESTIQGRRDVVKVLLRAHADVNATDFFGKTALLAASEHGREEIAGILLDAGADANRADRNGLVPLESAANHRELGIAKLLLQHGATVDAEGGAPLLVAAGFGDFDLVQLLVEHGASTGLAGGGKKALLAAVDHLEIAKYLLSQGAKMPDGTDGLLWAIETGSVELVRTALAQTSKAQINAISLVTSVTYHAWGKSERLPLIARTTPEVAAILLDAGFDPNAAHGRPLAYACESGNLAMVELLLHYGANPNLGSNDEGAATVPLIEAVVTDLDDDVNVVRALLAAHADPNTATRSGRTALIEAAEAGNAEALHLLIAAKADLNKQDSDGHTALMLAVRHADYAAVRYLLSAGAAVNSRAEDGSTALIEAAAEGSPETLSMLLEHGARVGDRKKGRNAEQIAVALGNREATRVLRADKGANSADLWLPQDLKLDYSQTPGQIRRSLLDSPILRDMFLIAESTQDAQDVQLSDSQSQELNARVVEILAFLKRLATQRTHDLDRLVGGHRLPVESTTIQLVNTGVATAETVQSSEIPAGRLLVDVKLLRAAYASSVQADRQLDTTDAHPSIATLFQRLEADRKEIEQYADLADLKIKRDEQGEFDGLVDGDGHEVSREVSRMADRLTAFAPKILPASIQYYGILLFVVAHELGHVALGHGLREIPCLDRERAADHYAAVLLSDSLVALSIASESIYHFNAPSKKTSIIGEYLAVNRATLADYTGFSLFFAKSYELAHFPPSSTECVYPEPKARVEDSLRVLERFASAGEDRMLGRLAVRKNLQRFLDAGLVARQRLTAKSAQVTDDADLEFVVSIAKELRLQGYTVLGSRVGAPGDLFAEKDAIPILIHTLSVSLGTDNYAIEKAVAKCEVPYGFSEVWLVGHAHFSPNTRAQARDHGVRLFDFHSLKGGLPRTLKRPNLFGLLR